MARFRQPNRELRVRQVRRVEELLPVDHQARFVWGKLMALDFGPVESLYPSIQGGPGTAPFHPRVMVALWVYAMCQGIPTAAGIARACRVRDDFRWLAGGLQPSDQTLLNFIARTSENEALRWIWLQVLWALQDVGQIDMSAVLEDGTKVRANASPRSFRPAAEIAAVVQQLKAQLSTKLDALSKQGGAPAPDARQARELHSLRDRLARAELAASELERRRLARADRPADAPPKKQKLATDRFKLDAERDVLVCPAGESLSFCGAYPTQNRRGSFRLYKRTDCRSCPRKASCTDDRGRRVKIFPGKKPDAAVAAPDQTKGARVLGPCASLTDPQAVLMLATSVKTFAPAYNADITVTRQGFIVSQFLTQNPTDYPAFERALPMVLESVGRPDCWIGDGHYGTLANLLLADRHQVPLYAPAPAAAGSPPPTDAAEAAPPHAAKPSPRFHWQAFVHQEEPDALICPDKKELRFVNVYPADGGKSAYRLYQRSDCSDCSLKPQCTSAQYRRVKVPVGPGGDVSAASQDAPDSDTPSPELIEALLRQQQERLAQAGERARKLRGQTCEPANAHLKVHGLDRLHVRGLKRGSVVLTLACIAHNLLKWQTREARHVERAAA